MKFSTLNGYPVEIEIRENALFIKIDYNDNTYTTLMAKLNKQKVDAMIKDLRDNYKENVESPSREY